MSLGLLGYGLVQKQWCPGGYEPQAGWQGCGPLEALAGKDFPSKTEDSSKVEFLAGAEPMGRLRSGTSPRWGQG